MKNGLHSTATKTHMGNMESIHSGMNDIHFAKMMDVGLGGEINDVFDTIKSIHLPALQKARNYTEYEIQMRIDAIVSSPEILKKLLGDDLYLVVKNDIVINKGRYDELDDASILKSKGFITYKENYLQEKITEITNTIKVDLLGTLEAAKKIDTSDPIENEKIALKRIEADILDLLNIAFNKQYIDLSTFKKKGNTDIHLSEIYKKIVSNETLCEKFSTILDFYIPLENSKYLLKKATLSKKMQDFDNVLRLSNILREIDIKKEKLAKKTTQRNQTSKKNIEKTISKNQSKIPSLSELNQIYQEECLTQYKHEIFEKGNDDVYGQQDLIQIKNIQTRFTHCIEQNTTHQEESYDTFLTPKDRNEVRGMNQKNSLLFRENFDLRSYVFNRMIEYCILEYVKYLAIINLRKKNESNYLRVEKTSLNDDIYSGADFSLMYKKSGKDVVKFYDLIISNKEDSIEKKRQACEKPKKMYDFFLHQAVLHQKDSISIPEVKRNLLSVDPTLAYPLVWECLSIIEKKGMLYDKENPSTQEVVDFFSTQLAVGGNVYKKAFYMNKMDTILSKGTYNADVNFIPKKVDLNISQIMYSSEETLVA